MRKSQKWGNFLDDKANVAVQPFFQELILGDQNFSTYSTNFSHRVTFVRSSRLSEDSGHRLANWLTRKLLVALFLPAENIAIFCTVRIFLRKLLATRFGSNILKSRLNLTTMDAPYYEHRHLQIITINCPGACLGLARSWQLPTNILHGAWKPTRFIFNLTTKAHPLQ